MFRIALIMTIPLLVSFYTTSFGIYNWRQGNKIGAIGVYLLAFSAVGIPFVVLIAKQVGR